MKSGRTSILFVGVIFGLAVGLSACSPATPPYKPVFVEKPCLGVFPEYKVRCGTVTVPEDRQQSEGNPVMLSVAVVEQPDGSTGQPPVIVLNGGPGFGIMENLQYRLDPYGEILAGRPIIFFDQRGSGLSQPALDCPEILESNLKLYSQDLPDDEETRIFEEAIAACKARLEESGISLASYTTAASADDVRDIVIALGYPKVYLFGTSYGTFLGQVTLLRHQSEGWIAGAILDSVVPLQVDTEKERWTNTQEIFKYIFRRCAEDPACNARYPDLQQTFYATLDQLRQFPMQVTTFDPQSGSVLKVKMDDEDYIHVLFSMIYDPFQASNLPQIIDNVSQGDTRLLAGPYRNYIARGYGAYEGMSISMACTEDPTLDLDAIHQANAALDQAFQRAAEGYAEETQKICQLWDVKPANAKQNRALKTDLPILILSGDQDPITPLAWGELLHTSIPASYFYAFPGTGHAVFYGWEEAHNCAESLLLQFLKDSSQPPDGSCVSEVKPFPFRIPSQ